MSTEPDRNAMAQALRVNIERLRARRLREERAATPSHRLAAAITAFAGSMAFVAIHFIVYAGWIVVNLGLVPAIPRFDPSFVVLAMEASVEAIFLSTFILISQNRMVAAADRRADLDLHVNLLAEHELTKLAGLVMRIAEKLGIAADDPDVVEIAKDVQPEQVLDAIDSDHPA